MTSHYPQPSQGDRDLLLATAVWLADVPAPADALPGTLQGWVPWTDTTYGRGFIAYSRSVDLSDGGQATVEVQGWQTCDGTTERTVAADLPPEMTGQEAAAVAAALTEAARHA